MIEQVSRNSEDTSADPAAQDPAAQDPAPPLVREQRSTVPPQPAEVLRSSQSIRAERRAAMLERYGGFYWGADFLGMAVSMFFLAVFLGVVGAIVGTVGFQLHAPVSRIGGSMTATQTSLGMGALVGSLLATFLAFFIGGYAAGRMARFDGARNGLGVVIWTVIVAVILGVAGAIAGSQFDVASRLHLNVDVATLTVTGLISILVALLVATIAAALGGLTGERYHRRIDRDAEDLQ